MPAIQLHLLGSPSLAQEGIRVEFDTRKALALLAYLVVMDQPQNRDTLSTFLWPDNAQTGARGALRRTLSVLKTGLPEDFLEISREQIAIAPSAQFWCDAIEFQHEMDAARHHSHQNPESCGSCLESLEHAVELYKGDFLAGFTLRDSPAFDDWQFTQTDHFRQELEAALQMLALAHSVKHSYPQAITYVQHWLSLDPLREEAHRQLMLCYAWAGQRNKSLQQYRRCAQILEKELNVPPLDETTQLYHAILEGRIPTPPSLPGALNLTGDRSLPDLNAASSLRISQYPLVGRSKETETILRIYQTRASQGHLLVLHGEPGVGKTRLAEEFLAFAQNQGARVLAVRCYAEEGGLAYAPFMGALRSLTSFSDYPSILNEIPPSSIQEAARLVPELILGSTLDQVAPWSNTPGAQTRFFEGLRQVIFSAIQGEPPGILFLDDFDRADSTSLQLFMYLIHRLRGQPILILVTWRDESLPELLNQIVIESQRVGTSTLLELTRLRPADLDELVRLACGSVASKNIKELATRIYEETEGLPFFVVEYLQALPANISSLGVVDRQLAADWPAPLGVQNLLRSRLRGLDETAQQILTTAAVIGRSFDFNTLQEASGRSEGETLDGLERLLAGRLIDEVSSSEDKNPNVYDFTHDKLRQMVYEHTNLARRRLLHRRVAETLTRQYRSKPDSAAYDSQIARHYQQAGLEALAAETFRSAGDHAASIFAHREAINHYQAALALGYPRSSELYEKIGDLQVLLGEYSAAVASYHAAAPMDEDLTQARLDHKLGNVCQRRGEFEFAYCHYQSAFEVLGQNSQGEQLSSLYADWSQAAYKQGKLSEALKLAQFSLDLAQNAKSYCSLAKAHNFLGVLARANGDTPLSQKHLETSLEIAQENADLAGQAAALNNLALLLADIQDYSKAIQLAEAALEICQKIGDKHHEAVLLNHLSELCHADGQVERSMEYLKSAVRIFAEIGIEDGVLSPEIWMLSEW